jgi:predicted nucleotidyltransferase
MVRSLSEAEVSARKVLAELARRIPVQRAYLFGSYVTGKADEDSDIDLAVFSPAVDEMTVEEKVDLIARVGQFVRERVEIHLLPDRLLRDATPADFAGFVSAKGRELTVAAKTS